MSRRTWDVSLAGAAYLAFAAQAVMASEPAVHTAICNKIAPVVGTIDVFVSSTAPAPARKIEKSALPKEVCRLKWENSRYLVKLDGEDVWVPSNQFSGLFIPVTPYRSTPREGAGTKMGEIPWGAPDKAMNTTTLPEELLTEKFKLLLRPDKSLATEAAGYFGPYAPAAPAIMRPEFAPPGDAVR